jgi:hypothetical protein
MSPTGHLAIGFSAKKYAPQVTLLAFLGGAYFMDLIYFLFLLLGIETYEFDPWSHSLLMAVVWSIALGLGTLALSKNLKSGCVMSLVVFSHFVLDFIVWSNLPIAFDQSNRIGLGLYDKIGFSITGVSLTSGTVIATLIELGMLAVGVLSYGSYVRQSRLNKSGVYVKIVIR